MKSGRHFLNNIAIKPSVDEVNRLRARFPGTALGYHELGEFYLPERLGCYLDYGCGDFSFARRLVNRFERGFGVDVMKPIQNPPEHFSFQQISIKGTLPFPDEFFDSASIIEVIEHVPEEKFVLSELARVLKTGGKLVITTPHRGILTWIDSGNWKFWCPTFHRWMHIHYLRNQKDYQRKFGTDRPSGLYGDISGDHHKHYSLKDFIELLPSSLEIDGIRVSYPGMRFLWAVEIAGRLIPFVKNWKSAIELPRLRFSMSRIFGLSGDQLTLVLRKV